MEEVSIIGLDLAKRSFQAHGSRPDGGVAFRKKLSREKVLAFFAERPRCIVAMEACGSAHHWGRVIGELGHEVRLIPPTYVKPFVKRQKNDAADAEAICEAASRPTMRFVSVKTEEQQSRGMIFRTRDLLVRQRTQLINALRGHLSEHGVVASQGPANLKALVEAVDNDKTSLPLLVVELSRVFLDQIDGLTKKIVELEKATVREAGQGEMTHRLQTIPGVGPITAMAIETFAPPMSIFKRGRDFAAWLGLVPRQYSTGGKQLLGKTSKMGQRDIRRLLIIGAMAVVRWALQADRPTRQTGEFSFAKSGEFWGAIDTHTVEDLVGEWNRPYSRETACFPAGAFRVDKYWPSVNRVDNAYGDRHLVCACPPMETYIKRRE